MAFFSKMFSKPHHFAGAHEARSILGEKNVFGPDEWKELFGRKFQVTSIPEIPWNMDVLKNPGIDQQHFLFLGLDVLGGEPLNIPTWDKLYPGKDKDHQRLCTLYFRNIPAFYQHTCDLRWYLVVFNLRSSTGDHKKHWGPYDNLIALLPGGYEVPGMAELVTGTILYYLLNQEYPDPPELMVNTSDRANDGNRAILHVTKRLDMGLNIIDNFHLDDANDMADGL